MTDKIRIIEQKYYNFVHKSEKYSNFIRDGLLTKGAFVVFDNPLLKALSMENMLTRAIELSYLLSWLFNEVHKTDHASFL